MTFITNCRVAMATGQSLSITLDNEFQSLPTYERMEGMGSLGERIGKDRHRSHGFWALQVESSQMLISRRTSMDVFVCYANEALIALHWPSGPLEFASSAQCDTRSS